MIVVFWCDQPRFQVKCTLAREAHKWPWNISTISEWNVILKVDSSCHPCGCRELYLLYNLLILLEHLYYCYITCYTMCYLHYTTSAFFKVSTISTHCRAHPNINIYAPMSPQQLTSIYSNQHFIIMIYYSLIPLFYCLVGIMYHMLSCCSATSSSLAHLQHLIPFTSLPTTTLLLLHMFLPLQPVDAWLKCFSSLSFFFF
jgi:hypothetical protein